MTLKSKIVGAAAVALAASALAMAGGQANALPINSPVPSNAYITYGGLDWAWGGACPYSGGCYATGDLSYQSTQGWSLPTAADMAMVDALDASNASAFANLFLVAGKNVPIGGSDPVSGAYFTDGSGGACASPYFDTAAGWCDGGDGKAGLWQGSVIGQAYGGYYDEQLYVRSAVPEASTWALMMVGFAGLGSVIRRRRASIAA